MGAVVRIQMFQYTASILATGWDFVWLLRKEHGFVIQEAHETVSNLFRTRGLALCRQSLWYSYDTALE
jgi:hypothetical protein